jgi:hypothetical protein
MPGPGPTPGESTLIYDGSKVYWTLFTPGQPESSDPKILVFEAANGAKVKLSRIDGSIIP